MLELRSVRYRYAGFERRVLDGVDLTIGKGEIVGLIGSNGAGKTTLCLVAAGVAPRSIGGELDGEALLQGQPLGALARWELASSIGLLFSNPDAQRTRIASTVFEEVAFGPMNVGLTVPETAARTRSALSALAIDELAERHPGHLSGGQTQLVAVAGILAMAPRYLILDEPFAELDAEGRRLVADALRRLAASGTGLLVADHDRELLGELCTRIVAIEEGRIVPTPAPRTASATATPAAASGAASPGPVVLRCSGLAFSYPDGTRALDDVDLSIGEGETVAIVGRNGSGKTTLAGTLNGLLRPTGGDVQVAGRSTAGQRVAALARRVGLTFQDSNDQLFARTCRDEVAFGARNVGFRGRELDMAVTDALEAVGLASEARTNPFDLGPSRRRLLGIGSVLAMRTEVVVLDEPTMGVDDAERARVGEIIRALADQGRTVVGISHDAPFVTESFRRVVRLDAGRVVADGPPATVLAEAPRSPE